MRRRDLLKSALSIAALPLAPLVPDALAATAPAPFRRVRPSDPGWPNAASWSRLKEAVGGNLVEVQPLLAPCVAERTSAACTSLVSNLDNPFFIGDQPAGTQVSGWLDAWTPAASAYAIHAQSTADVVAGVNFARDNRLRLVVKGTGHSYLGTSNAPDSLLIWTRAMNRVTLHDAFVPKGCEGKLAPVHAVTAEAGCLWIDLYYAVTQQAGRYVQGGGCTDVGVAGLVQSGGFGSFSKGFGTAASGLLEAEIVTADGIVRTVNAASDPELFWALKGGGGGSWGVVTRLTLRTLELPKKFGAAWGRIHARSDEAYRRLIAQFLEFYAGSLLNEHWGEQVKFSPNNKLGISMVSQGLDTPEAKAVWAPFIDWLRSARKDYSIEVDLGVSADDPRDWWKVDGNDSLIPDKRTGAPKYHAWWKGDRDQVGAWLHGFDSLWLSADLLRAEQRPRLVDALFAASRDKLFSLHLNKGLAGAPASAIADARDTATNPAVCEAFALAIIADGEEPAYPGLRTAPVDLQAAHADADRIATAASKLRAIVPNPGSYVSESNFFNANWQREYFGDHYARLQAVKSKYDPEGLFFVHNGVGSERWSADGFTRLA